jgi:hypothetical protein
MGPHSFKVKAARAAGGQHCFVFISCEKDQINPALVSYLGNGVNVVQEGASEWNNDTEYSDSRQYERYDVSDENCDECELERKILEQAEHLREAKYRIDNYGAILGPNSNTFARQLIEGSGGKVNPRPDVYGWSYVRPIF